MLKRSITLILFVFLGFFPIIAEDKDFTGLKPGAYYTLRAFDGYVFVYNNPGENFMLRVKGKKFVNEDNPGEDHILIRPDGITLQVAIVKSEPFLTENINDVDEKQFLLKHLDWEIAYDEKDLGAKLDVKKVFYNSPSGRLFLYWEFLMPKGSEEGAKDTDKMCALTTKVGSHLIMLSAMVYGDLEEKTVKAKLFETAFSMKLNPKAIGIEEMRKLVIDEAERIKKH